MILTWLTSILRMCVENVMDNVILSNLLGNDAPDRPSEY